MTIMGRQLGMRTVRQADPRLRPVASARRLGVGKGLLFLLARNLFYLLSAIVALYLLIPQAGGLRQTWQVLHTVRWEWLVVGVSVLPVKWIPARSRDAMTAGPTAAPGPGMKLMTPSGRPAS